MASTVSSQANWSEEERQLRRKEVGTGRISIYVQALALLVALVAALAAAYAAVEAGHAVRDSALYNAQQEIESQLTTAISAIGGSTSADQVAGLTLLRRNVATQVDDARPRQSNWLWCCVRLRLARADSGIADLGGSLLGGPSCVRWCCGQLCPGGCIQPGRRATRSSRPC